jgi:hypothetical protein
MTILLVWNSYIWNLPVALPCIYVLLPDLVHFLYFPSFYVSPFLMVVSAV